jgi:hypothetical protein
MLGYLAIANLTQLMDKRDCFPKPTISALGQNKSLIIILTDHHQRK